MANKRPLIIAIIFGIIAVVLVYAYIKSKEEEMAKTKVEYGTVVLANDGIPVRTTIKEGMVSEEEWPLDNIPENAYSEHDEVLGKISSDYIHAGIPLFPDQFKEVTEIGELAFRLKHQERALTIGVTEIKAVGGNVKPGDHVDVLATFKGNGEVGAPKTITVLRDVRVVAVGRDIGTDIEESGGQGMSKSITLALSPQEAETLALIDENSSVRLSLRNPEDRYAPLSMGVTISDVVKYTPTREEKKAEAERAEAERKAAEEAYLRALRERNRYQQLPPSETGEPRPLPPIQEGFGPREVYVEVILGGEAERVAVPVEEEYGIYSVWPMAHGMDFKLFPVEKDLGE